MEKTTNNVVDLTTENAVMAAVKTQDSIMDDGVGQSHVDIGTDVTDDIKTPPRKKKKLSSGEAAPKTSLQILNELMPGLKYNCISQTGPVHQPTFTVQVIVKDKVRLLF